MGHIYALLLTGSDIRFLGTTGPESEPDSKKTAGYPATRNRNRILGTSLLILQLQYSTTIEETVSITSSSASVSLFSRTSPSSWTRSQILDSCRSWLRTLGSRPVLSCSDTTSSRRLATSCWNTCRPHQCSHWRLYPAAAAVSDKLHYTDTGHTDMLYNTTNGQAHNNFNKDIWFLGTTGRESEPDSKNSRISGYLLYNKFATSQCQSPTSRHVKMLGCGKCLSVGGEFVVQQVVELLWARPLVCCTTCP